MIPRSPWPLLAVLLGFAPFPGFAAAATGPVPGPFFEEDQPFFQSQVELVPMAKGATSGGNFVIRGLVLPLASGYAVVFDQELLRVGAVWKMPAGGTPITLTTMAQISYATRTKKVAADHPHTTGPALVMTGVHPGVASDVATLFRDPRPEPLPGDSGRGALPGKQARFDVLEVAGTSVILHYRSGTTEIQEWMESSESPSGTQLLRHLEVAPHDQPLLFALGAAAGAPWTIHEGRDAVAVPLAGAGESPSPQILRYVANSPSLTFTETEGELVAQLAPSKQPQRVTLALVLGQPGTPDTVPVVSPTPVKPTKVAARRWPQTVTAPAQLATVQQNGLVLDRIATPDENPWNRRVRVADLAFLDDDRAAVVTYDGDVWIVNGLADDALAKLSWQRYASGLHEPLAIAAPKGVIQVATKNGVIRLHDRDGNGEADWYENFNDQMLQAQTTRSFPLDMAMAPDGSTYVTQGGIVTRSGLISGGEGTRDTGAVYKISPDGKTSFPFATGAREPFVSVNPVTGVVTATDQQGHFIPSSVSYFVREGDAFGYLQDKPAKLTPPLVWVPHELDISSSSEAWMIGKGMGAWNGKLLHLSYGTGRIFVITPDLDAPTPQGAVIPLELKTELPLLHARMNPQGDALFFAGFQLWGTRTTTWWALGRLRPGKTPITTAIAARSTPDGVILEFGSPLDVASLKPEKVQVRAWNYQRSKAYGSGRYALDGSAGTTVIGVAQIVPSADRKSVFVHLPHLPEAMQVELRHDFLLEGGAAARGSVYATIHHHHPLDLAKAGFPGVDLAKAAVAVAAEKEEPATAVLGKTIAETFGCAACHSADGSTEGKVGPSWKGLFGAKRTFIDGTSEVADEVYIREKILDPQQKKTKPGQIEMPSFKGVLGEQQMESLVLYIKTLAGRRPPSDN